METRSDYFQYRYVHQIHKPYLFFKAFLKISLYRSRLIDFELNHILELLTVKNNGHDVLFYLSIELLWY